MNKLFTVHQLSKSCAISRATILRLEEKGLLKPARIDGRTGYRYYDTINVTQILQIKLLLEMGMGYDDILLYYRSGGTSPELVSRMERKYMTMKRAWEETKLRTSAGANLSLEFIDLPEYVCYCREYQGTTVSDRYWAMYGLIEEVVEKGYRPLPSEPIFIINKRTDFIEGTFSEKEVDFICCVPLEPDCAPDSAVVYPACRAYSCLFRGSYDRRAEAHNLLGAKIRELGLKPTGYVRALGLVAPATGREVSQDNYISRLVVPVEE